MSCIALLAICYQSHSRQGVQNSFESRYPNSAAADRDCQICHQFSFGGGNWNAYGYALLLARQSVGDNAAYAEIEEIDSDGDGLTNLFEIENELDPGWTKGFTNTFTYANNAVISEQAPGFADADGGFNDEEEVCFPIKGDFDFEASIYC